MRPDVPPHGAQSAPWGPRRSGATTAERGPHRASCARWGAISGIFEEGATQSAGMHRRPNAVGLSPRAVRSREAVIMKRRDVLRMGVGTLPFLAGNWPAML